MQDLHAVGGKHLERRALRWLGERVRVHAEIERAGDALALAVLADRLADRQDVVFVEVRVERRAAVARRAEAAPAARDRPGRDAVVVLVPQRATSISRVAGAGLPASGLICSSTILSPPSHSLSRPAPRGNRAAAGPASVKHANPAARNHAAPHASSTTRTTRATGAGLRPRAPRSITGKTRAPVGARARRRRTMEHFYHIIDRDTWRRAQAAGSYHRRRSTKRADPLLLPGADPPARELLLSWAGQSRATAD